MINIQDFQFCFRNQHSTIDQAHRVIIHVECTLEEKKYCTAVFLDVSQPFDRVWHQALIYKMAQTLPENYCRLLTSYLPLRTFGVAHEDSLSSFYPITAGVPQGSVLGPLLYLLYTADIPTTENTVLDMFADDTVIMATDTVQEKATGKLQIALNNINQWTRDWKIKLNGAKSTHVVYTLRHKNRHQQLFINNIIIPQAESAKYLGLHLDGRLNWKNYVRQKAMQTRQKVHDMYWLIGRKSKLSLKSKKLIYQSIKNPMDVRYTALGMHQRIKRCQNKCFRIITDAYRYVTNDELHNDLAIKWVDEVIQD